MKLLLRRLMAHPPAELIRLIPLNIAHVLRSLSPERLRARAIEQAFDREHGVDTAGYMSTTEAGIDPNTSPYQAIMPGALPNCSTACRAIFRNSALSITAAVKG